MGIAKLIEPMSKKYIAHAEYNKIPVTTLRKLMDQGHPMRLLCIVPMRMDVLFFDFKNQGYDSMQKLDFTQK